MPFYPYKDELSGYQIDLHRPFGENHRMPEDHELPEEERGKERKWVRLIADNIKTTYAQGSGKGNWIYLLGLLEPCTSYLDMLL